MITITPENKARWNKAIEKCRAEKPLVKFVSHGVYSVTGSKGDSYTVTWAAPKGGDVTVECSCKAGKKNTPCYHIPPTASLWKQSLSEKQAAKAACTNTDCDGDAIVDGLCQDCNQASEESRIAHLRQAEATAPVHSLECFSCEVVFTSDNPRSILCPTCQLALSLKKDAADLFS